MRRSTAELRGVLEAAPEMTDLIDSGKLLGYLKTEQGDGSSDLLAAFPFCLAKWWSGRKTRIPESSVGSYS